MTSLYVSISVGNEAEATLLETPFCLAMPADMDLDMIETIKEELFWELKEAVETIRYEYNLGDTDGQV